MATKYRIPKLDDIQGGINAFDDLADTIANPPEDKPLRQAIGQAGRLYCDFVGSQPGQAILPWTGQGLVAPLLCKPYWDSEGYDAPVPAELEFEGGQCSVSYRPSGTYINSNPDAGPTGLRTWRLNTFVTGPLRGLVPAGTPVGTAWGMLSESGGGQPFGSCLDLGNFKDVFGPNTISGPFQMLALEKPVITATNPTSGNDDCGDPPGGDGFQPGPNPPPTPTFPPGEGPGTEPDGQPFFFVPPIPNPIGGDPIDVPPQPDPDPDPPVDDTPTDPGDAGDPEDTGAGGEASGCAPEGSELTGVFVEIVEFPENAARFQNNSRQPFRGAGYIAMGWPDLLGVDISGGVINLEQFFHAQQRGVTCWRVTANTGFDLRCTPYYREVNPEEEEE